MATHDIKLKKYVAGTTNAWEDAYPETTHTQIIATGTADSTTFLRGDGAWAVPAGSTTAGSAEKVTLQVRFGEAVSKGDPVYISGYHGSTGPVIMSKAKANDSAKMPAFGLADDDYAENATGYAVSIGVLEDIDTDSYTVGDTLYVAPTGGLTDTKPTGSNLIQNVGTVSRSNLNNGSIEVTATGRSNDVPNLTTGKLWVGSANNTIESATLHLDETNNRLGIGTTSPAYKLDVLGKVQIDDYTSTRTAGLLKINSESGTGWDSQSGAALGKIQFWSQDASGIGAHEIGSIELENDGSNYYQPVPDMIFKTAVYNTAAAERMRITSDGKVGIGTSTPTEKLTVYGDSNTSENSPVTFIKHNFTGTHGFGLSISRDNSDIAALALGSNSSLHGVVVANNTNLVLGTISSGVINDAINVKTDGKVGIGTTSPGSRLDVLANAKITSGSNSTHSLKLEARNEYLNDTGSSGIFITAGGTSTVSDFSSQGAHLVLETRQSSRNIYFKAGNTTSAQHIMDYNGNVGIGTTSPGAKLDVDGNIAVSGTVDGVDIAAFKTAYDSHTHTSAQIYDGTGTDQLFSNPSTSTPKLKIEYLPDAVFDSLYFQASFAMSGNNVTNTNNLTNVLQTAMEHALTNRKSASALKGYYFVTTTSAGTINDVESSDTAKQATNASGSYSNFYFRWDWNHNDDGQSSTDGSNNNLSLYSSGYLEIGDWFVVENVFGSGTSSDPYYIHFSIVQNTYEVMVGASEGIGPLPDTAGSKGLVPSPGATDYDKFLRGDGTWTTDDTKVSKSGDTMTGNLSIENGAPSLTLKDTTDSDDIRIYFVNSANSNVAEFTTTGNRLNIGTSFTNGLSIDADKVGIGTTTPEAKLEVQGNTLIGSGIANNRSTYGLTTGFTSNSTFSSNADVTDSNRTLSLVNESTTTDTYSTLSFRNSPSSGTSMADFKYVHRGTNSGDLIYTNNNGGTWTDQFSILSDGKVGIGTTTPSYNLDVAGNIRATGWVRGDAFYDDDNSNYYLNPASTTTSLVVAGNVGIGTTSPNAKLDIQQGGYFALITGADVNASTLTDSTRKFTRIGMPHYTNTEESVSLITGDSDGTDNILHIGGGTSVGNAATQIHLKTSANATTVTGTTRLFVASGGNVGIGTTSPSAKLDVAGSARFDGPVNVETNSTASRAFYVSRVGTTQALRFYTTDNISYIDTIQDENTGIYGSLAISADMEAPDSYISLTGNTIRLSGDVGIGTASPGVKLQVQANTSSPAMYIGNSNAGGYSSISFRNQANTSNIAHIGFGNASAGNTTLQNKAFFGTIGANDAVITTSDTVRMTVASGGNVGIGTTNPKTKLNVASGTSAAVTPTLGSAENSSAIFTNSVNAYGLNVMPSGSGDVHLQVQRFDGSTSVYDLNLQPSGGNVGIGTTTPGEKLEVNGKIKVNNEVIATKLVDYNNGNYYVDPASTSNINNLTVQGNLTVNGTTTTMNTTVTSTDQWTVTNAGTDVAAIINQTGSADILDVQDNGTSVFKVKDGGDVEMKTDSKFTVGASTTVNEAKIILDASNAGHPQIGLAENNDASWALGVDDTDNSFKIHGASSSTIPTIGGLTTPHLELDTTGNLWLQKRIYLTSNAFIEYNSTNDSIDFFFN